jgi:HEPN domain-containing protein
MSTPREEAERLTFYGVITRYPGGDRPVTEEEAVRAIRLAEQVAAVVRSDLQANGLSVW